MEIKQVIVMRKDLKMRRGKEIAQASHAAMAFITRNMFDADADQNANEVYTGKLARTVLISREAIEWLSCNFAKICVQVDSEEALLDIFNKATAAGLEVHLVTDSGLTEFNGVPTKTCLAIGPDSSDEINKITGDLKLY